MLAGFKRFYVQEELDRKRLIYMAADPDRIIQTGNMKFICEEKRGVNVPEMSLFREIYTQRTVITAGSTHAADEKLMLEAIKNDSSMERFYIVAPRKVSRAKSVFESFQKAGLKALLYSQAEGLNKDIGDHNVLILDTMGLLSGIYDFSHIAYIGGGFEKTGVHSVIEPFTSGVFTCFGPNIKNFQTVAQKMIDLKCGVLVSSSKEFSESMEKHLGCSSDMDIRQICLSMIDKVTEKLDSVRDDIIDSAIECAERMEDQDSDL
jgi:3-deoxy-D-manno-octulosonic-acid transferase